MNNHAPSGPSHVDAQTPKRIPYHTPVLQVHGSLGRLTQGGGLTGTEGTSGMVGMA